MSTSRWFYIIVYNGYIYLDNYTGGLLQVDEGESSRETGKKRYELKNHLGNVLSVVTDKKFADEVEYIPSIVDQAGISVTGDEITRTATGSTWGDAGGASGEYIYGDGYVSRTLENTRADNQRIVVGLSYENIDAHYNKIDYGLFTKIDHTFIVWESGATEYQGGTRAVGDVLKVAREGNEIKYYQNDNVLRTVTEDPSNEGEPLLVDFAMFDEGTSIYKLRIGNRGYVANVTSAQDYYPFGSIMPGRNYNAGDHRFGFNGQERTDEISGLGNHTTALYWEYNTRLGRRWNPDPKPNPSISQYATFANNPILYTDILGDTVRNRHVADYQGKGQDNADHAKAGESLYVGDYTVTPQYDKEDNLIGYAASRGKKDIGVEYYLDPEDLGNFEENIDNYTLAADLFYMNGVPSEGMIATLAGDTWKGLKMLWSDALRDPQFYASVALSFGHSAVMVGGARVTTARNLRYAPKVRQRAIEGGAAHRFPYSYDEHIIRNGTMTRVSDSYTVYRLKGSMINEVNQGTVGTPIRIKEGVYELGIENGVVTHRTFTTSH